MVTPKHNNSELENLIEKVEKLDTGNIVRIQENKLPQEIVLSIVNRLSRTYGIVPELALTAIYLLFLKGASNKGCPNTISVTVIDPDGVKVEVFKSTLLTLFKEVTGTSYLRRLAETLNNEISIFAEHRGLVGDLAVQINNKLKADTREDPKCLSNKQKAWCSSFNQNNNKLESDPDLILVSNLLARDFESKFKTKKTTNKKEKNSPRSPGEGKTPKGGKKGVTNKKEKGAKNLHEPKKPPYKGSEE